VLVYSFRWERWSWLAGVLFVALFMIALALTGNTGDDPDGVQSYYADSGNQIKQIVAFFLMVAAAIAFISWLGTLRALLVRGEDASGTLTTLVLGSGLVGTALMVGGFGVAAAPAILAHDDKFTLDANTAEMFNAGGYALVVGGTMVASILVLATSMAALRTNVLPAWLGWAGLVAGVSMLFAFYFIPLVVFAAWVLMISLLMIVAAWKATPVQPARTSAMG
jgi:hypothetical protein